MQQNTTECRSVLPYNVCSQGSVAKGIKHSFNRMNRKTYKIKLSDKCLTGTLLE